MMHTGRMCACTMGRAAPVAVAIWAVGATAVAGQAPRRAATQPPPQTATTSPPHFAVSVTRTGDLVETVAATREVDAAEIDRRDARTLDEALRFEPGLFVRTAGAGVPRIDLRGLRGRHVLLLVDGVPLRSGEDGQIDLALVPTEFIGNIRTSFGASSLLYGEGSMGGAIEVTSRGARPGLHGRGEVDLRQGGQRLARALLSSGHERLDLLVSASRLASDGFPLAGTFAPTPIEDGGLRDNADRDRTSVLAKVRFAATPALRLGTLVTYGRGGYGVPPGTIDAPHDPFAQRPRFERVDGYRTLTAQASADYTPDGPIHLLGWMFTNRMDERRTRYDGPDLASFDDPRVGGTFARDDATRIAGGALHLRYEPTPASRLKVALDLRRDRFETAGRIQDVLAAPPGGGGAGGGGTGRGSGGGGSRGGGSGGGHGSGGAAATPMIFAFREFAGVRSTRTESAGLEWELRTEARTGLVAGYAGQWQQREAGGTEAAASWLAGIHHDLTPGTRLRGSIARKVRFPSIRQLYDERAGNPSLEAERALNLEAGLTRRLPRDGTLDVAAFWMNVTDLIELDDGRERFGNRARSRIRGLELSARTRPVPSLDLRIAYTLLDAMDRSPEAERRELQYRPRHRVTLEGEYALPLELSARVALEHVAGQVFYSRRPPLLRRVAGDYTRLDLRLAKRCGAGRHTAYVGLTNALDANYEQSYGLPREGRQLFVGLRSDF